MDVDELETIKPKKSFLEGLMILGTGYFAIGTVPISLFCLAVAKDVEVKPVGPDFDPMRFGTGFSIVLMILLFNTPFGLFCAAVGRLVAKTLFWQRIFLGFAIYYFLVLVIAGAVFAWA